MTRLLKPFLCWFSVCALSAISCSTWAAEPAPLFSAPAFKSANARALFRLQLERGVARAKLVDVNLAALDDASGQHAPTIAIDLFDGTTIIVDRERLVRRG